MRLNPKKDRRQRQGELRQKIVLRSAEGKPTHQIAKNWGRPTSVSKWATVSPSEVQGGWRMNPRSGRLESSTTRGGNEDSVSSKSAAARIARWMDAWGEAR